MLFLLEKPQLKIKKNKYIPEEEAIRLQERTLFLQTELFIIIFFLLILIEVKLLRLSILKEIKLILTKENTILATPNFVLFLHLENLIRLVRPHRFQ
jgi:hypothetical protein